MNVHISGSYKMITWMIGFFTLGIGAIGMWWSTRCWPQHLDAQGMTLRNGKRVAWSELTDIKRVTVVNQHGGGRITGRLQLHFGKIVARIVPQSLAEGHAVIDYISQCIGQEVDAG